MNLKVFPVKTENQVILHPAVKDVAVVGIHHDQDGEHPTAFVVLKNAGEESEAMSEEILIFTNGINNDNNIKS